MARSLRLESAPGDTTRLGFHRNSSIASLCVIVPLLSFNLDSYANSLVALFSNGVKTRQNSTNSHGMLSLRVSRNLRSRENTDSHPAVQIPVECQTDLEDGPYGRGFWQEDSETQFDLAPIQGYVKDWNGMDARWTSSKRSREAVPRAGLGECFNFLRCMNDWMALKVHAVFSIINNQPVALDFFFELLRDALVARLISVDSR
ncbi:hypothetical protein R3P38DRAFT_1511366 [Favolaschia claudopus]|uniref:Uncharacterized protein n=1 Tax=Favolaschia claudopus TaxID=2862362 RepID=A0AAW0AKF9_9AGAR